MDSLDPLLPQRPRSNHPAVIIASSFKNNNIKVHTVSSFSINWKVLQKQRNSHFQISFGTVDRSTKQTPANGTLAYHTSSQDSQTHTEQVTILPFQNFQWHGGNPQPATTK